MEQRANCCSSNKNPTQLLLLFHFRCKQRRLPPTTLRQPAADRDTTFPFHHPDILCCVLCLQQSSKVSILIVSIIHIHRWRTGWKLPLSFSSSFSYLFFIFLTDLFSPLVFESRCSEGCSFPFATHQLHPRQRKK